MNGSKSAPATDSSLGSSKGEAVSKIPESQNSPSGTEVGDDSKSRKYEIKRRNKKSVYSSVVEATIQQALCDVRNPFMAGLPDALMKRKDKV